MIHKELKPVVTPYNGKRYQLKQQFDFDMLGVRLQIKEGFVFDGASIPRLLWVTTGSPFDPELIGPALVHDDIYRYHYDFYGNKITRHTADLIFRELLELNGVGKYQRNKMYAGVRTFGRFSWK